MGLPAASLASLQSIVPFLSIAAVALAFIVAYWWLTTQRRAADDTIAAAKAQAERLTRDAEREAETIRKEAALEAREKAHALTADAERLIRQKQDDIASL
jgi:ribonuclease Y